MLTKGDAVPGMTLTPVFGRSITLPADLHGGPLIVVFMGALASSRTRGVVALLQEAYADLDREGTRLVVVTGSALERARDFVPRYHLLFPLVVDEDGGHRVAFGLVPGGGLIEQVRGWVDGVKHLRAMTRWGRGLPEPGVPSQMAWFCLGVDGCITESGQGAPLVSDLVRGAGVVPSSSSG